MPAQHAGSLEAPRCCADIVRLVLQQGVEQSTSINVAARALARDGALLLDDVRRALEAADPRVRVRVRPHGVLVKSTLVRETVVVTVLVVFRGAALVVAVAGLYGVTAHAPTGRRAEIGLRLALGATPGRVVRLVLRRLGGFVLAGGLAGVMLATVSGRAIESRLYGVDPGDLGTASGAALLLLLAAGAAAGAPAWRAARVPPAEAMRPRRRFRRSSIHREFASLASAPSSSVRELSQTVQHGLHLGRCGREKSGDLGHGETSDVPDRNQTVSVVQLVVCVAIRTPSTLSSSPCVVGHAHEWSNRCAHQSVAKRRENGASATSKEYHVLP